MEYIGKFWQWVSNRVSTNTSVSPNMYSNQIVLHLIDSNPDNKSCLDDIRFYKNGYFEITTYNGSSYYPSWLPQNIEKIRIKGYLSQYITDNTYADAMNVLNIIAGKYLSVKKNMSPSNTLLKPTCNYGYIYINGVQYDELEHSIYMKNDFWNCIIYMQKLVPIIISSYYTGNATVLNNVPSQNSVHS
jgi:hypothetical protein